MTGRPCRSPTAQQQGTADELADQERRVGGAGDGVGGLASEGLAASVWGVWPLGGADEVVSTRLQAG
jgi:hypothetical protein